MIEFLYDRISSQGLLYNNGSRNLQYLNLRSLWTAEYYPLDHVSIDRAALGQAPMSYGYDQSLARHPETIDM